MVTALILRPRRSFESTGYVEAVKVSLGRHSGGGI
jgi:hypothetical protein